MQWWLMFFTRWNNENRGGSMITTLHFKDKCLFGIRKRHGWESNQRKNHLNEKVQSWVRQLTLERVSGEAAVGRRRPGGVCNGMWGKKPRPRITGAMSWAQLPIPSWWGCYQIYILAEDASEKGNGTFFSTFKGQFNPGCLSPYYKKRDL